MYGYFGGKAVANLERMRGKVSKYTGIYRIGWGFGVVKIFYSIVDYYS